MRMQQYLTHSYCTQLDTSEDWGKVFLATNFVMEQSVLKPI